MALSQFQASCDKLYENNEIMKRLIERRRLVNELVQSKMFDKTKNKLNEQ